MLLFLLLLSLASPRIEDQPGSAAALGAGQRLVAHALGGIDGRTLTNAYDAFAANYAKGFRAFEIDLSLTADGGLAAVHDWPRYLHGTLGLGIAEAHRAKPVTMVAFRSAPVEGKYRPLALEGVVRLLEEYPDVRVVIDLKDPSAKAKARAIRQISAAADVSPVPGVRERIVPQIFDPPTYRLFEAVGPFPSYIFTLYGAKASEQEAVEFVRHTPKIRAVAMPVGRAFPSFISRLKQAGVRVFVHTVNDRETYAELRKIGVDGVYTDFLSPVAPDGGG